MQDYATCTAKFCGTEMQCEQIETWLLAQDLHTAPVRQVLPAQRRSKLAQTCWHLSFHWPHLLSRPSKHLQCFESSGVQDVIVTWRL